MHESRLAAGQGARGHVPSPNPSTSMEVHMLDGAHRRKVRIVVDPEVVLPQQQGARYALPCGGERRLMLAVLEDAINVYGWKANDWKGRTMREEVRRWFAATDYTWPFSFVNICDVLGLEAEAVRRALAQRETIALPAGLRRVDLRAGRPADAGTGYGARATVYSPSYVG